MKKRPVVLIPAVIFAFIILASSFVSAATPVLYFSDLTSGPNTGGKDNKGAFVTVFGNNFGASRGSSYITVGNGQVDNYPLWSNNKISFQLGPNAETGDIVVHTSDGDSNALPFMIRNCDIYFVSISGNDNNDGSFNNPWRHLSKARDTMSGGDISYIRGGTYTSTGEDSSGELFYLSGGYPWGSAASDGNPHCIVGYPGETVIFQATANGESIINYVNSNSEIATSSNIVFADFIIDANNYQSGIGWRGVQNGASKTNRVKNVRFVNIEVKNYKTRGECGGAGFIEFGGDGPIDNVSVLGCYVHNMDTSSKLDHGIYVAAGGDNYEIAWNIIHDIKTVTATGCDGYAGFGIQGYRGSDSDYADLTNLKIHDNLIYECPSRGGINLADYTINSQVYNNIVYNCGYDGKSEGYGLRTYADTGSKIGTHYIYNNIFYNCGQVSASSNSALIGLTENSAQYAYLRNNIFLALPNQDYIYNALSSNKYAISNNLWYGNGNAPSLDTAAINSNPQFVDLNNHDFHLQASSPAIDAGIDVSAIVTRDFDGILRPQGSAFDIGAYEYLSSAPIHPADTNQNGKIEMTELIAFIGKWKLNQANINDVITALERWFRGG